MQRLGTTIGTKLSRSSSGTAVTCDISDHLVGVTPDGALSISPLVITGMTVDFDIYLAYQRNVQNVSLNLTFGSSS